MIRLLALVVVACGLALAGPVAAQDPAAAEIVQDCATCPQLVPLGDGSMIGRYPVTRDEFAAFAADTGFSNAGCRKGAGTKWAEDKEAGWDRPGFEQAGNHPVVCVSWTEATTYVDWLTEKTGKSYRLPTVEESTLAAAAGGTGVFAWGDDPAAMCANVNTADVSYKAAFPDTEIPIHECDDGYPYTSPVDAFTPNALGIYDGTGNVWQWTNSCLRGDCANAVMRGGGWNVQGDRFFKLAETWGGRIGLRNYVIGFRVLRDAE